MLWGLRGGKKVGTVHFFRNPLTFVCYKYPHVMSECRHLSPARRSLQTALRVRATSIQHLTNTFFSPIPHREHELYQWLPLLLESSDGLHWPQHPLYLEHSSQHARCLGPCQSRQLSSECCHSCSSALLPLSVLCSFQHRVQVRQTGEVYTQE